MTRSAYAVTSALTVACSDCNAGIGQPCGQWYHAPGMLSGHYIERGRSHSARRLAADKARTKEVNPEVMKP